MIILSLIIIFSLVIQKFESNVTNEKLLYIIEKWHINIKDNMNKISNSDYNNISKKVLTNWLIISLTLFWITNQISVSIFGVNSTQNLLNNNIILISVLVVFTIFIGLTQNRKDFYVLILFISLGSIVLIYNFFESHNFKVIEKNTSILIIISLI
mgnify:CR=1 FL=1